MGQEGTWAWGTWRGLQLGTWSTLLVQPSLAAPSCSPCLAQAPMASSVASTFLHPGHPHPASCWGPPGPDTGEGYRGLPQASALIAERPFPGW